MSEPVEQLVLEYLASVADSAQRHMNSSERLDFLARLRARIEERLGRTGGAASPAQVRKVLARFGDPEALVLRERGRLAARAEERAAAPSPLRDESPEAGSAADGTGADGTAGISSGVTRPGERTEAAPARATTAYPETSNQETGYAGEVAMDAAIAGATDTGAVDRSDTEAGATGTSATGTAAAGVEGTGSAGSTQGDTAAPDAGAAPRGTRRGTPAGKRAGTRWAGSRAGGRRTGTRTDARAGRRTSAPRTTRHWPSVAYGGERPPHRRQGRNRRPARRPQPVSVDATGAVELRELIRRRPAEAGATGAIVLAALLAIPGLGGGPTALGLWLLGTAVAASSSVWNQRDKLIGLLGPAVITLIGVFGYGSSRAREDLVLDFGAFAGAWFDVGPWIFVVAGPAGVGYLGWRLLSSTGARTVRLRGPTDPPANSAETQPL